MICWFWQGFWEGLIWLLPNGKEGRISWAQSIVLANRALWHRSSTRPLLWAMIWGVIFWQETPDVLAYTCIALIVGSGIYAKFPALL